MPVVSRLLLATMLAAAFCTQPHDVRAQIESDGSDRLDYGAHLGREGWLHFGLHAPAAEAVELLLFEHPDDRVPAHAIPLARQNGDWRVKIRGPGVGPGLAYLYRARGPREVSPDDRFGLLFNEHYPLGDPYAYRTQNVRFSSVFASTPFSDTAAPVYAGGGKSVVHDHAAEPAPQPLSLDPEDLILYELHVQDYTARLQGLEPALRGTYLGLARSGLTTPGGLAAGIDHLAELGVTAVELMPVMEYDEETGNAPDRLNHWGYMTTNFLAPEARYAAVEGEQVVELKRLVEAFHARGIAVFLDVVYNHTGEQGPWVEQGRLAAKCYNLLCSVLPEVYRPSPDGRFFSNNTGTGNDLDFAGPKDRYTKRLVLDSLRLWRRAYGIDGFRFDLARVLADGSDDAADWVDNGHGLEGAHLHAEPWDAGGVWWDFMDNFGWSHENNRWAKWIGQYRDRMRRFSQSTLRDPGAFKRLIEGRGLTAEGDTASTRPWRSVNFVAVHDGYTLRDCTLFNDAGGSHNCWDSDGDEDLRRRRSKLLMGLLLTSQGVPLILQGDEFGRSKSGALSQADAHNSYNYESASGDPAIDRVNWIDWGLKDGAGDTAGAAAYGPELFDWTKRLIALRKRWHHFRRGDFAGYVSGSPDDRHGVRNDGGFTYAWEGPAAGEPSQLAVVWWGRAGEPDLMVLYNEHWQPFTIGNLADWSQGDWKLLARSWLDDEADFCSLDSFETCPDAGGALEVGGRSLAILVSDND